MTDSFAPPRPASARASTTRAGRIALPRGVPRVCRGRRLFVDRHLREKLAEVTLRHLEEADDALDAADGINPETGLHFSDYIDVDSFIDHIMLNNFAMNVDWGRLSAFLHKSRGGKLVGGPIWDFDRNMGSEDGRDRTPDRQWNGTGDSSRTWYDSRYPYYGKVMGYRRNTQGPPTAQSSRPDVMQRWIDRWFSLRKSVLSIENLNATVDKYASPLNVESGNDPSRPTPQDRNFARWNVAPNGGTYSGGDRGWTGEITHITKAPPSPTWPS